MGGRYRVRRCGAGGTGVCGKGVSGEGRGVTCEAHIGLVKGNVFISWDGEDTV